MLNNLQKKFEEAIHHIRGFGVINEDNIKDILKKLRIILLEADVELSVIKTFLDNVKEKALSEEVRKSLKPSELFIKIVHDELINLFGEYEPLNTNKPVIMLVGLQGSGKTTTSAKLANYLRKKHSKKPLLIAADTFRKAAKDQLIQLGKELNIDVYTEEADALEIIKNGVKKDYDAIIIDTRGRLHVDVELQNELKQIQKEVKLTDTFLVVDSMMGQDAINIINGFNENINLTGIILTKMDSDASGGVALTARSLTNLPIKFLGTSEKMDGLEYFDSKRMADRLLGKGDLLGIVEKVNLEDIEPVNLDNFSLDDFLKQLKQIKKMGSLESIIKMIPGASKLGPITVNEKDLLHMEAILSSMTKEERKNPDIIKASRKIRIAKGSGTEVSDVNRLLKQYDQMKIMTKQLKQGKLPFKI